jgi:hypothetical protein
MESADFADSVDTMDSADRVVDKTQKAAQDFEHTIQTKMILPLRHCSQASASLAVPV